MATNIEKLRDFAKLATVIRDDHRTNFDNLSKIVRETYCTRQTNRDLQWPPCFAEKLVKLDLHQETYNVYYNKQQRGMKRYSSSSREQVEYDGIFKDKRDGTKVKKVLIEGDAGIGKTTLCTSISVDWAKYKTLKQFELLLLLPLRDQAISTVNSVFELLKLFHPNEQLCQSVADSFLHGELGKNVLLIADGWDELESSYRKPGSFICKLLFSNAIHSATVLITSRPSASILLHKNPYIDRFIEIAGFDQKGIEQYIESEFSMESDKASRDGLLQQIKDNPLIRSICHVPINCAIVCHMWRSDESLPSNMTLTDIYTKIILHFILRAFQKTFPEYGLESLNNFDAIPEDMQERLWLLCKFAYDALEKNTYVFSYKELKEIFPQAAMKQQSGEQFTFGLMQSAQAFLGVGRGASFHFLHRTFQEYMSAMHIVKQESQTQTDLMKPHAYTSRMAMVMRFVAGLGSSDRRISSSICPLSCDTVCEVYEIDNRLRVSCVGWTNDLVVHGIYEAKEGHVKNYLLNLLYGDYFTFAFPRNAHDCVTVVNAIDNFQKSSVYRNKGIATVSLKLEHCSLDEQLLTDLAAALYSTEGQLQIKLLLIQDNKLSDKAVCSLMRLAAPALRSLKQLSLAANCLGAKAISAIPEALGKSSMEHLTLSYNPLGTSGVMALVDAIKEDTLANLTDLQLKNCSLKNSEACASLFQVLPDHCIHLKQIDVSDNLVDNPIILGEAIGNLILGHKNVSDIFANEVGLGDSGFQALINVLNRGSALHIGTLSVKKNNIHSESISLLAECIQSIGLHISDGLYVDNNPIELKGAVSLCTVLHSKTVSMSNCKITTSTENTKELLLHKLSKLPESEFCEELILDSNSLTKEHIYILAQFIRICPLLQSLSCAGCEINSDDLIHILKNPACSLMALKTLSLQNNKLDDEGCSAMVPEVKKFPKLTGIFLHGNPDIKNKRSFDLLEKEVAKHRPKGDVIERVLTTIIPGVPYEKIKVLVEKHNAYEYLTDEDQDPVLMWDEYIRRGEEQRQQAELIMGWTMSFQDENLSDQLIDMGKKMFSMKNHELGAEVMTLLENHQHFDYQPTTLSDEEEPKTEILNENTEKKKKEECEDVQPQTDIKLPGGSVIPASLVSNLATQFLGQKEVPPDLVGAVTQFGQSPFGQAFLGQLLGEDQGSASPDDNSQILVGAAQALFNGQGSKEPTVSAATSLNFILQNLSQDIDYSTVDSSTKLCEDDLREVNDEVAFLKAKYYQLGVALGLPPSELDAIKSSYHQNIDQALTEVLLLWLRGKSSTSNNPPPTWQSLVKALDSRTCDSYARAKAIASRHPASSQSGERP